MTLDEAIDIVARGLLANARHDVQWEDLPDIGEYDFDQIMAQMLDLAPPQPRWSEAIQFLESRVEIGGDGCRARLEAYGSAPEPDGAAAALASLLGLPVRLESVPCGALTPYREVRSSKPILRLRDLRPQSRQSIPRHL